MSRLKGLADNLTESLNLNSVHTPDSAHPTAQPLVPFPLPPKSQDAGINLPSMPPQMESVRSHTADEIVGMMNKTPLFMTSLEDAGNGMPSSLL